MTYPANPSASASATCPPDLLAFSECYYSPSESALDGTLPFRLLGAVAVGLALAGVVLPVLPTTPFLLIATWAFARSSPRLDAWLRGHPWLGAPLAAWESRRAVPCGAKAVAGISLPGSWLTLLLGGAPTAVLVGAGAAMLAAIIWIMTRPS
jgi:uncharacterized membrane protein YbaN (DUF454 family)